MINFLRFRVFTFFFTLVWMATALVVGYYRYQEQGSVFSYSIDFTGGKQFYFRFNDTIAAADVQKAVALSFSEEIIARQVSDADVIVRIQDSTNSQLVGDQMLSLVKNAFPNYEVTLLQSESVGPGVGQSLWFKSLQAIFLSMLAILLYIAFRFWSFAFSIGAVLALLHDALAMLAFILLLDVPISVNIIGAIVAILGYSINDTIVIFSQIREYLNVFKGEALSVVINRGINKTLRRTTLTSLSTALPIIIMYFFGGDALKDFSLVLLAGIAFGTFSSIFIASPIMMPLYRREKKIIS